MKIAIKFGDNDFYNTWQGVLKVLREAYIWQKKLPSKEQLCKIINELSYPCYLLFQNQFEYNEEKDGNMHGHTYNYLQITEEQILIDKEVEEYWKNTTWDNSETFIMDTSLKEIICI